MKNVIIQESAMLSNPLIEKPGLDVISFVAVLQEAGKPNRNHRIYPKDVLEEGLESDYIKERLATNTFYGEAGHPLDQSLARQMTVDQHNIAFLIKEVWWEGNLLKARCETANTIVGQTMKNLIEQGSRVAFSLRAQGNVHKDPMTGLTMVDKPIQIISYDWVINPSHEQSWISKLCESVKTNFVSSKAPAMVLCEAEKIFNEGKLIEISDIDLKSEVKDYASCYNKKLKNLDEVYVYDKEDKLNISEDGKFGILENNGKYKKVMLEDYITKDIRNKIKNL